MAESNLESNAGDLEEYDLYALYRIIMENSEEWVMMVLSTPICNIPGAPPLPEEVKVHHMKYLLVYVPEILPSSLCVEYRDPNQLEDGDVLVIHSLWMWKTYAIVSSAKEKKVICFATRNQRPVSDMGALFSKTDVHLQEVVLDEVLGTDHGVVEVIVQENPTKTLRNARTALTHGRPWRLFGFNSEHFVTHAATGKAQSPQLDNLLSVQKKAVLSGIVAGLATPESCAILQKCAKYIASTATNKAISGTKAAASQVAKQTVKEATEEVASATAVTATSRLASGAKAGLIGGVVVEGACLAYTGYSSYKKMGKGEITERISMAHGETQCGSRWICGWWSTWSSHWHRHHTSAICGNIHRECGGGSGR